MIKLERVREPEYVRVINPSCVDDALWSSCRCGGNKLLRFEGYKHIIPKKTVGPCVTLIYVSLLRLLFCEVPLALDARGPMNIQIRDVFICHSRNLVVLYWLDSLEDVYYPPLGGDVALITLSSGQLVDQFPVK